MDRRGFLKLFGTGLPAAVVCEKVGLLERVRSYFFAPAAGWVRPEFLPTSIALQLESVSKQIPVMYESDAALYDRLAGIPYYQTVRVGEWRGLDRSSYPTIDWDRALEI